MANPDDSVFDPEPWGPALDAFGAMTQLTVQLYDRRGELRLGPIPSTPLFALVAEVREPVGFADCARECLSKPDPDRVVTRKVQGLGLVGTSLRLGEHVVGVAVAGYVLTDFSTVLGLQRLAHDHGLESLKDETRCE
jgi:hypothetical protein